MNYKPNPLLINKRIKTSLVTIAILEEFTNSKYIDKILVIINSFFMVISILIKLP